MTKKLICALTGLCLALPVVNAQTRQAPKPVSAVSSPLVAEKDAVPSALDAPLFYQLLVGELNVSGGEAVAGISLILNAAQKTKDPLLYQRATDLALQSRSGDGALQAARAWRQAWPDSLEANRYVLQILLALNRVAETADPLKSIMALTPPADLALALAALPRAYARVSDKKLASLVVEKTLATYLDSKNSAAAAWTSVGRLRLAAEETSQALDAAKQGQAADEKAEGPVLLALELMDPKLPEAEALVNKYLGLPSALPEIRMAYARSLLDQQRYDHASVQLQQVTREKPEFADGWLVLGSLQLQENKLDAADASLKRYLAIAQRTAPAANLSRGLDQAYVSLSQVAEKRKDLSAAQDWLNKVQNPELVLQAQTRRATLLARQGKVAEGRQLIQKLPERTQAEARAKQLAEIGLLREIKQYQAAYDLLGQALKATPDDTELLYEQAMVAEKLSLLADMERLLKLAIELKPDDYHAYNALGYSLADRGLRLQEAKELIQKALTFVPADPFIQDSLGWVEFRMGNKAEALRILEAAFKARPDAEIAAHMGEVLWSMEQKERAIAIWKEGNLINAENETLRETIKRLGARL